MKIKMILIALTALLSLASCGDDDSGIQLTQDEIIGDINTGKKYVLKLRRPKIWRNCMGWM